ncbi:site-2 protease family protein [Magnetococcus sp. PR-3]|uniref:site-2 protease family protein n=1 Tax=Magnetococcus sp. PR-3 TaxID=3120355 RepID=UPI002FCE1432
MLDINSIIQNVLIWAPGILLAITLHEWAHGYAASRFGDHTAAMMGRLSLNPLVHIDLMWTIVIPVGILIFSMVTMGQPFAFGGAKPVPVNPRNFHGSLRVAMFWVALAGPLMNLVLAVVAALLLHGAGLMPDFFATPVALMLLAMLKMNVILAVFNLLPMPPLDGGRIAVAVLPHPWDMRWAGLERWGIIIVMVLAFSGLLGQILGPMMSMVTHAVASVTGLI